MEQFFLGVAYWIQNNVLPQGIVYFNEEDVYTISPYPEKDIIQTNFLDMYSIADLVIRYAYGFLNDEYSRSFKNTPLKNALYIDPYSYYYKKKKDESILKLTKKELEKIPNVKGDKRQRSNLFVYLLKYCFFGFSEANWDKLLSIIQYLVITKRDNIYGEFIRDFDFILNYTPQLPRKNHKNLQQKGLDLELLENFKAKNEEIRKKVLDMNSKFINYFIGKNESSDDRKVMNWLSFTISFLFKCSHCTNTVLCNGLKNHDIQEGEEVFFECITVKKYSEFDQQV